MPFVVTLRAHVLRTLYPYRDCFEAKVLYYEGTWALWVRLCFKLCVHGFVVSPSGQIVCLLARLYKQHPNEAPLKSLLFMRRLTVCMSCHCRGRHCSLLMPWHPAQRFEEHTDCLSVCTET